MTDRSVMPWPEINRPDSEYLELAASVYSDPDYGSPWQELFLARCGKSKRTMRRWLNGEPMPGPVRAMILAHARCKKYGIDF